MAGRQRVGVIFGGASGEHDISLLTARGVLGAIDTTRYDVVPIGISKTGGWAVGEGVLDRLSRDAEAVRRADAVQRAEIVRRADAARDAETARGAGETPRGEKPPATEDTIGAMAQALSLLSDAGLDAVFPLLHGPMGEDGALQGLLEFCGVPYVGCGVAASAVAMDKGLAKDVFRSNSIPTLPWTMVPRGKWRARREQVLTELEASFPYPLFVKPANLGSSVGISKAGGREELQAGLDLAARHDERLLVEPGIDAREIEVAILGNANPRASVPGEIRPHREFYDYQAKYFDDATELIVPAELDDPLTARLQALAIRSFEALACAGLARVDFLLERGTGEAYISEVNTMPGFTATSMYPRLWEASGVAYGELIDRLLDLAQERRGGGVV